MSTCLPVKQGHGYEAVAWPSIILSLSRQVVAESVEERSQ